MWKKQIETRNNFYFSLQLNFVHGNAMPSKVLAEKNVFYKIMKMYKKKNIEMKIKWKKTDKGKKI